MDRTRDGWASPRLRSNHESHGFRLEITTSPGCVLWLPESISEDALTNLLAKSLYIEPNSITGLYSTTTGTVPIRIASRNVDLLPPKMEVVTRTTSAVAPRPRTAPSSERIASENTRGFQIQDHDHIENDDQEIDNDDDSTHINYSYRSSYKNTPYKPNRPIPVTVSDDEDDEYIEYSHLSIPKPEAVAIHSSPLRQPQFDRNVTVALSDSLVQSCGLDDKRYETIRKITVPVRCTADMFSEILHKAFSFVPSRIFDNPNILNFRAFISSVVEATSSPYSPSKTKPPSEDQHDGTVSMGLNSYLFLPVDAVISINENNNPRKAIVAENEADEAWSTYVNRHLLSPSSSKRKHWIKNKLESEPPQVPDEQETGLNNVDEIDEEENLGLSNMRDGTNENAL